LKAPGARILGGLQRRESIDKTLPGSFLKEVHPREPWEFAIMVGFAAHAVQGRKVPG
jgi:hypothetical protein